MALSGIADDQSVADVLKCKCGFVILSDNII